MKPVRTLIYLLLICSGLFFGALISDQNWSQALKLSFVCITCGFGMRIFDTLTA